MLLKLSGRPSISSNEPYNSKIINSTDYDKFQTYNRAEELKFELLVNEAVPENTKKFSKWFLPYTQFNDTTLRVLFQIVAACYAMRLVRMNHNDLHTDNIWVERVNPTNVSYIYDGNTYTFIGLEYKAFVFDFDRAYVEKLGDNTNLDGLEWCSQTNIFLPNKDIIKFMGYVYELSTYKDKTTILDILCPSETSKIILRNIYFQGVDLRLGNQPIDPTIYTNFRTPEDILYRIAKLISSKGISINKKVKVPIDRTFTCNQSVINKMYT